FPFTHSRYRCAVPSDASLCRAHRSSRRYCSRCRHCPHSQPAPYVRLVGLNAPETSNAACPAEADLGARATRRLRELVKLSNLDFEYVRCSCPEGTQGTFACNYGRNCGTLKSNGRDVGTILIAEGLAVSFKCGAISCPPTPRPWCPHG